jgi:predicted methyltransferase
MKPRVCFEVILLACIGIAAASEPSLPAYISAALADPHRPVAQQDLDPWRKPGQLLAFAGLKPHDKVADFMPGNAYFTRLFSKVVGPDGQVYAFLPTEQLAHCSPDEVAGTQAIERDGNYPNVRVMRAPAEQFATPESLDVVWIADDYHDLHDRFMRPTRVDRFNSAVFRALKPGGRYVILDHAAAAGSGLRDTETLHRIDPESIRSEVTAAGFVLEAESGVLRSPTDDHRLPVFDPAVRHRTDQVILRFRKPERGITRPAAVPPIAARENGFQFRSPNTATPVFVPTKTLPPATMSAVYLFAAP